VSLPLGESPAYERQIHLNSRASLSEFVMDFPRDGSTLRFAYGLETIRESAQLIKGCSELLFRALTIRNLGAKFLIHSRKHCGSLFISKLQQLLALVSSALSRAFRSCPRNLRKTAKLSA